MNLTDWTNLSIILLSLEAFILLLPILILLFMSLRGLRMLHFKLISEWFPLTSTYVTKVQDTTLQASVLLVEPSIQARSVGAGIRAGFKRVINRDAGSVGS
jgi:hypothetical protein